MTSVPTQGVGSALPTPPGRLGQAASREDLLDFLATLEEWLARTRGELDRLDEVAQRATDASAHSPDVVLAMALWQALRSRTDDILVEWDSGRADTAARERISTHIWGRLGSGALDVTLPEGARLVDALVGQLREQLAIDPSTVKLVARLRQVRAELVRCEDLARAMKDDEVTQRVEALAKRQARLLAEASRGADVTGPLGELEADVARAHRDLLVTTSRSGELRRDRERATELRDALAERRPVLLDLEARCRREIARPPRLAVPDPQRLGDPPQDRAGVDAYLARLDAAARAVDAAEHAYAAPLRERASLRYRLAQAQSNAQAHGRDASTTVQAGWQEASDAVTTTPCDVDLARALVAQYERLAAPLDLTGQYGARIGGAA
ncbi:hypothetical protein [Pseudactinotalea sp.]|uniref:hypothetical protein n=1 Tax=Pseudactinotalea sp. TaxID=1926260 RepID=UPI003B3B4BCD